jgi:hypothetical protein
MRMKKEDKGGYLHKEVLHRLLKFFGLVTYRTFFLVAKGPAADATDALQP